jgi:hypothetical protein
MMKAGQEIYAQWQQAEGQTEDKKDDDIEDAEVEGDNTTRV